MRVDKFLWCVRLSKTRSLATELVSKGKVKIKGEGVKPSREVKIGDLVSIQKNNATFTYKITQLLSNRIGAKLVSDYIIDVTDPLEVEKYKEYQLAQNTYRSTGTGKPTKKDRRDISGFLDIP